nr:MAG TPA: hypothetical protein [Caudoviricetes sp.]
MHLRLWVVHVPPINIYSILFFSFLRKINWIYSLHLYYLFEVIY